MKGKKRSVYMHFSSYPHKSPQKPPVIFLGSILVPGDAFFFSLAVTANL